MRILICGGRDFNDWEFFATTMHEIEKERSIHFNPDDNWLPSDFEIISGMAKGADTLAVDYAVINWLKLHEFPADWNKHGRSAGPIRNIQMLKEGRPDLVVAFPGGRGTAHMVKIAKEAGVEVIEVESPN